MNYDKKSELMLMGRAIASV